MFIMYNIRLSAGVDIEKPCYYCGSRHSIVGINVRGADITTSDGWHCCAVVDTQLMARIYEPGHLPQQICCDAPYYPGSNPSPHNSHLTQVHFLTCI